MSKTGHISHNFNGGKINPDLQRERDKASFDIQELACFIQGGEERYRRRVEVGKYIGTVFSEICNY